MYGDNNQNYNQNLYGDQQQQAHDPYNQGYGANSGGSNQYDPNAAAQQYG